MGCAQTSASVIPPNHIPIERLYDNQNYSLTNTPPVIMITAPPIPSYVKSALKKSQFDGRGRTEGLSFLNRKLPSINKSVNFDEQVLVKARTPTPSKIWYEKSSTTMPMRKHRRNDDDDDDYDEEEIPSSSSDEEQENNEQTDTLESPPPLSLQRNQPNTFWYQPDNTGFMPTTNTNIENESFTPTMQQSFSNMNPYATETSIPTPINRIKVRRKLPNLAPPQILPASSYQSPYQSTTVPAYQIHPRTSFLSPYQSYVQRTISNPNAVPIGHQSPLINGESSPQTAYYAFNRHPLENVT